ncbi:hypothetical protein ABMA28_002895 [Loxostege sticticalis]|uniref:Uncharacterized protein n=1 Tax=Loxostege sticticalis TaxID=481309 RepID=A0ABD0SYP2_LOXSC
MNRNQRRLGRMHQKRNADHQKKKDLQSKSVGVSELEEVFPPKAKRSPPKIEKFTTNKSCYVAPIQEDFGQLTDSEEQPEQYQNILQQQYGFDPLSPLIPDTINQLKELRRVLCNSAPKVENSSQYTSDKKVSVPEFEETVYGSQWQNIDNADEIDKYISQDNDKLDSRLYLPGSIRISEIPRIKIIAKKFSRFKKNNVELRKLDEKVVCVEYDVYLGDALEPREKLRAFFSIRPTYGKENRPGQNGNNFNISSEDLKKLNEKEIEIIDGKISENKTYLEDLKRILRRTQALYARKNKTTLDLMSLYEMAKRESPPLDDEFSNTNFLSKAGLQEMKDLILRKCASSVQGVSRRTVRRGGEPVNMDVISQSILAEVWREAQHNE